MWSPNSFQSLLNYYWGLFTGRKSYVRLVFDRGILIALTSKYMNKRNSTHLDHIFICKIVFKYDDKLLKGENNQHTYKKYN